MISSSVLYKPNFRKLALWLGPGILLYGFVVLAPILGAFWHSLHSDVNFQFRFVGLRNYENLISDSDFWFAFRNNLIILGLSLVFQISTAFVIAAMMSTKHIRFAKFYRAIMFFPVVLSAVVVGFIWVLVYNIDRGLLNTVLRGIGLGQFAQLWLDDPKIVIYSVTIPLMWQYIGLFLVIFLAGLSGIPAELLESAEIDGANSWQKITHVTLPLMASTWRVVLILAISGAVKVFEQPFVMTRGGPGISSSVMAQYAYDMSFGRIKLTYGSAVAVVMLIISFVMIVLATLFLDRVILRGRNQQ
jgi:raffinose/stachyose/melibiose transport system permease protein